jgi:aminoglycoside phosphotransferase (APT) family kinase protein
MATNDAPPVADSVADLARALVASAGFDTRASEVVGALGTNENAIVTIASGERFVYRRYKWEGEGALAPLSRLRREAWQFDQLGTPRVLAVAEDPPALLLEFLPGETLGELAARGEASARHWHETGAAFRSLHELTPAKAAAAGIDVEPDDPQRDLDTVGSRLESLASSRPDLDLAAAWDLHGSAAAAPRRTSLLHGDAHLWNVLAGPRCVLIDLEKSTGGDPDFDLAYFDGLRFRDGIGPTPPEFYDGYGRRPTGPWYELHRIGIAATVVDVVARGYATLTWAVPQAERTVTMAR